MMGQLSVAEAFEMAKSSRDGLTTAEASDRLAASKPKSGNSKAGSAWGLLVRQFRSPLVAMLLVAITISLFLRDHMDAVIVGTVVLMSTLLSLVGITLLCLLVSELARQMLFASLEKNSRSGT